MTEAVASMLRSKFNLITGDNSAEELKINLGTAVFADQEMEMVVKGRDLITGLPTAVTVDTKSMHQALAEPLKNALEQIKSCIELAPHELIGDIINNGVIISGGVASLRGIDQYFSEALNIKCSIAPEPSYSSVLGMNRLLSDLHLMKHFFASNRDRISELE